MCEQLADQSISQRFSLHLHLAGHVCKEGILRQSWPAVWAKRSSRECVECDAVLLKSRRPGENEVFGASILTLENIFSRTFLD